MWLCSHFGGLFSQLWFRNDSPSRNWEAVFPSVLHGAVSVCCCAGTAITSLGKSRDYDDAKAGLLL